MPAPHLQFLSPSPTQHEIRQARARSQTPHPVDITELVRRLAQDPLISKENAVETLQQSLQSVPVDQFKQTLDQIEDEIDRLNLSLQTLKSAVIDLRSRHDIRKDENLKKLEALWQGTEFLPSQYKPSTLSQDLVQELFLLSKEVEQRGIRLHTLWEDKEEHPITLARLMRQQKGRGKRPFLTVGVVKKARRELKDLPAHGQKGGNIAEVTASLSEPEVELARHAPRSLADQSTSLELYENLTPSTLSPNDAARKETISERSPGSSPIGKRRRTDRSASLELDENLTLSTFSPNDAARKETISERSPGSSPIGKRRRTDRSASLELDENLTPSTFSPNDAARKETISERSPVGSTEGSIPCERTGDDGRTSPFISSTLNDDSRALQEVPLGLLRHGLRSTREDTRLNDIVVNTLIQRLRRPGIWTVDSLAIDSQKRNYGNPLRHPRCDAATNFRNNTVLIPFFDKPREHWLLLSVDTSRARVDVYDSLSSKVLEEAAIRDRLADLSEDRSLASPEGLKFYYETSPQQSNDKDCGVFTIAAATKLAERANLPSSWDVGQLRVEFATHLGSSGYAAPQGFRDFEAPHVEARAARSIDSLPPVADHPFQRWLKGIGIQKARCAIHGSILVILHRRHQSCLTDLDGFETECHQIKKDVEALITEVNTLSQRMMNYSRQLVDLQQELLRRVDRVTAGVRAQAALQDKRDAVLSLVPSRLLQIKTMIVLCHIFGPRFVVARHRLDEMQALQNNFLAQATKLLEES